MSDPEPPGFEDADLDRPDLAPPSLLQPQEGPFTRVNALAAVAAVLIGLATLLVTAYAADLLPSGGGTVIQPNPTSTPAATTQSTDTQPSVEALPASPSAVLTSAARTEQPAESVAVGGCLIADGSPVDCVAPHTAQVFAAAQPCDVDALREFLGASARDVIRPDVDVGLRDGVGCVVSVTGDDLAGSLAGAFEEARSEVGAQLRHCLDVDLDPTPCGEPHHGEVVGHHDGADECTAVAMRFLGRDGGRFPAGDLTINFRGGQCLVTVKGDNVLRGTIRDIGRRSLPIEART